MRCDLHVHSIASGMCDTPGLTRIAKESYNHPAEVYHRCKRLGISGRDPIVELMLVERGLHEK